MKNTGADEELCREALIESGGNRVWAKKILKKKKKEQISDFKDTTKVSYRQAEIALKFAEGNLEQAFENFGTDLSRDLRHIEI